MSACILTECGSSPPSAVALANARRTFQTEFASLTTAIAAESASNGSSSPLAATIANHLLVQSLKAFQHQLSETRWPIQVQPSIDRLGEVTTPVIAELEAHPSRSIGNGLLQSAASNPQVFVAWQSQLAAALHELGYKGTLLHIQPHANQ